MGLELDMHQVRVLTSDDEQKVAAQPTCWALWRVGVPCPNQATWEVRNTTNPGYSRMCEVHKAAFAEAEPAAAVEYLRLEAHHV